MRVLVVGATGYVGSRVVGALLNEQINVVAGARDLASLDRLWWSDSVDRVEIDVCDESSCAAAITREIDAVVYLVHGMATDDFSTLDATAARNVAEAVTAAGVDRVVYLSGIIPPIDEEELSAHLRSRLEVETILNTSSASVLTLRAAMILGAGSTSYELMTQLSSRLPVTVVPSWMTSLVEPIAVVDVVAAVLGALTVDSNTGWFDVGGGAPLPYPDVIARVAELRGKERPQIEIPALPQALVAKIAGWISDVPSATVTALMESLREDMVASSDRWRTTLLAGHAPAPLTLEEAVNRASAPIDFSTRPSQRDPMGMLPGDPDWADSAELAN